MQFQINSSKSHLLLFCIFLTLLISVLSKSNYPNAIAYETASKGNISAELSDEWANMRKVLKNHKMKKLGLLCVTGTFLLYAKIDYMAASEKEVRIVSGTDKCIAPGMARSIQAASAFNDNKKPSIVLFRDKILKGRGFPISKEITNVDRQFPGRISSIIINGKEPWTAYSNQGVSYCIKPTGTGICMLLNVMDTEISKDNIFYKIKKGCDTLARSHTVDVSNCISYGSGKLEKIGTAKKRIAHLKLSGLGIVFTLPVPIKCNSFLAEKLELDDIPSEVNEGSPIKDCNDNDELMKLLDIRMHHDFSDEFQMLFPKDKNLAWRTELLDTSFDITMAACNHEAVDPRFLQILRELYIYLAEKVWAQGKSWPSNKTEEVRNMIGLADHCLETLMEEKHIIEHGAMSFQRVFEGLHYPSYPEESYRKEFARIRELSVVMEAVWLIYNHVAAICHIAFDFRTNFWPDFSIMFHDMYLDTMKKHWLKPDKFQKYYQVLLGGYNIDQQLQGLAICVTDIFNSMQTLEILPRPNDLFQSSGVKNKTAVA